jgi:tetratricopeptide (TPR) repeat protein
MDPSLAVNKERARNTLNRRDTRNCLVFSRVSLSLLLWLTVFTFSVLAQEPSEAPSAAWHRQEGVRHLQNRDAQKALNHFRAAVQINPQDAESRFYIGAILVDSGQTESAVAELQRSIELNRKLHLSHYYLALAFDRLGRMTEAIVEYQEAIRIKPEFHDARYALSAVCWRQGDLDGAIRLLREVIDVKPDIAEARFNLALALKQKGNLDEAIKELQIASQFQPVQPKVYLALGQALAEKQNLVEAAKSLRRAVELAPADPEYRYNLGIALKQKGDLDAAEQEFREALKLNPRYPLAHRALGLVLRQKGELQPAVEELRIAVTALPDDPEARHNLGTALLKLNDFEGAISELNQAARLNPLLSEVRINLAQALRKAGRVEEARKEIEESQRILTRKANAGRAMVLSETAAQHIKSGELTRAIAELYQAISLNPEMLEAYSLLGSTLQQNSGDPLEIEKAFRRVLELNPRHAIAHYQLGLLLEKQGKRSEAIAEYRTAIDLAPSLVEARRALGKAAISGKDWETAATQFRGLIAWRPKDADAHFQLSASLKALGQLDEAEQELQTARRLDQHRER